MKKLLISVSVILVVLALYFGGKNIVLAHPNTPPQSVNVTVCHKDGQSGNYSKINVSVHSVNDANGLDGHGHHNGDVWAPFTYNNVNYDGQGNYLIFNFNNCNQISSPTPTASPTATPVATSTPTASPSATPTFTPTATPTPTSTPVDECEKECNESTPTPSPTPVDPTPQPVNLVVGAPEGPKCDAPTWAPTLTYHGRDVNGDPTFQWTTVKDGLHTYVLWYGPAENQLLWNTIVTGESVTLHHTPTGNIWAKVAGYDQGCTGPFSLTVDP
jgi:cell division septation protein DedD